MYLNFIDFNYHQLSIGPTLFLKVEYCVGIHIKENMI